MAFSLPTYHAPDFSAPHLAQAPDVRWEGAPVDGAAPRGFHSTSMHPEYLHIDGRWVLVDGMMMDDVIRLLPDGTPEVVPARDLRKGDLVAIGRDDDGADGIYVHATGFETQDAGPKQAFSFRQGRSRETSHARDYQNMIELLRYEREHGNVLWVMGPAFAFDATARHAMARLVEEGYVDGILAGNALATHDLEGAFLGTALGQNIYTLENVVGGHCHHLDVINEVRLAGSIKDFVYQHDIHDGIMAAVVRNDIPFVLAGSIRDDGPLPEVIGDAYDAQDAMHGLIHKATTVICMATMLHTIATGNLTPSYHVNEDGSVRQVCIYAVDASEFVVNKLRDRGTLSATSIVSNVHDFIAIIAQGLGVL